MQVALIDFLGATCNHYEMDDEKYPSQLAERFQVRMPDGMRERLRIAAETNGRSMNTEIIFRLQQTLDFDDHKRAQDEAPFPGQSDYMPDGSTSLAETLRLELEAARRDREGIKWLMEDIRQQRDELRNMQNELAQKIYENRRNHLPKPDEK